MKYNLQVLPSSIVNKSLKVKQAFLSSYESAQSRGLTEEECLFAGTQSALVIDKASKPALERVKPAIPMHLAAVLNKQLIVPSNPSDKPLSIKQEFLGKNAITPDSERILVSASWDNQAISTAGASINTTDISNAVWSHPFVAKLLTVAKFLGLK